MSIFNSSFENEIQSELYNRQTKLLERNNLESLIKPTAWIRASSGVNILNPSAVPTNGQYLESDFSNQLAKENVLFNNTFNQNDFLNGYDLNTRHGTRPKPGIIGLECNSFSPNGSLRNVTVRFNCWDTQQLEIMEQLYMRPGYLVCVEWGWSYELGSGKKLTLPNFGENFINNSNDFNNKTLLELYEIANNEVKKVNGNYDICIGKVQNFTWKLRKDNGYDCSFTVITYGEILDSWKINNVALDNKISMQGIPIGNTNTDLDEEGVSKYVEGKLCGILNDINNHAINKFNISGDYGTSLQNKTIAYKLETTKSDILDICASNFNTDIVPNDKVKLSKKSNVQTYITLGSLCKLLNYYILNSKNTKLESENYYCQAHPFQLPCDPNICLIKPQGWIDGLENWDNVREELDSREPGTKPLGIYNKYINDILKQTNNLIRNPQTSLSSANVPVNEVNSFNSGLKQKYKSFLTLLQEEYILNNNIETSLTNVKEYIENRIDLNQIKYSSNGTLELYFTNSNFKYNTDLNSNNNQTINFVKLLDLYEQQHKDYFINELFSVGEYSNGRNKFIYEPILNSGLFNINVPKVFIFDPTPGFQRVNIIEEDNTVGGFVYLSDYKNKIKINESSIDKYRELSNNTEIALKPSQFQNIQRTLKNRFENLEPYFVDPDINNYTKGNLANIYLNINFLYSLIKPGEINTNDKNNRNEITLNEFLRDILTRTQNSLGSLNSFEIYGDPIDNITKIIDKDYININDVKNDIFKFNFDSDKSLIIEHDIHSQIFPEQSTIVAISTQATSNKLGLNNLGLIQYNTKTRNRFVEAESDEEIENNIEFDENDTNNPIYLGISMLSFYTSLLKFSTVNPNSEPANVNFSSINNVLRDMINYWDSKHQNEAYKSMPLPIVIGLSFLGIAGIRIGNIFNVEGGSTKLLPASIGREYNFIVRNISQTINNNMWLVRIEGYPFKP